MADLEGTITVTEYGAGDFLVQWALNPVTDVALTRTINGDPAELIGHYFDPVASAVDPGPFTIGDVVVYTITDLNPPADTLEAAPATVGLASVSDRLWEACLLYAMRNVKVLDAPLGVAGGFDIGQVYVGRIDEDINRLLKGYRGKGVPAGQTWPTLDDLKDRLQISHSDHDAYLQRCLQAAIEQVNVDVGAVHWPGVA